MHPSGHKTGFKREEGYHSETKMAMEGCEFERAFRGAVQYALNSGFSEILELKPVQEEVLLHFIKREDVFSFYHA